MWFLNRNSTDWSHLERHFMVPHCSSLKIIMMLYHWLTQKLLVAFMTVGNEHWNDKLPYTILPHYALAYIQTAYEQFMFWKSHIESRIIASCSLFCTHLGGLEVYNYRKPFCGALWKWSSSFQCINVITKVKCLQLFYFYVVCLIVIHVMLWKITDYFDREVIRVYLNNVRRRITVVCCHGFDSQSHCQVDLQWLGPVVHEAYLAVCARTSKWSCMYMQSCCVPKSWYEIRDWSWILHLGCCS